MQSTLRLFVSRPIRVRFVRTLVRWLRARLREESPIVDRQAPAHRIRPGA